MTAIGGTSRNLAAWSAVLAGAAVLGALDAMIAYRAGTLIAVAVPLALIVLAAIAWRPTVGVYAGILAVPGELLDLHFGGQAGLSPSEGILLVTAASVIAHFLAGERRIQGPPWAWFTAFTLVALAGVLFADATFVIAKITVMWTAFMLASMWVAAGTREELMRVLGCIGLLGGIVGVIAASTTSNQELVSGGTIATNRAEGTFAHPNVLAFCVLLAFPLSLMLALQLKHVALRLLFAATAAMGIAGLALSLSRSGLVGAAVSLLVLLAWPRFRRYAFGLVVVLAVYATFNVSSLQDSTELKIVTDRVATLDSSSVKGHDPRFEIWRETPNIIIAHPYLGVGEGNFPRISPQYGLRDVGGLPYDHAHDLLLTIAAETGLIGLFVFVMFLISVAREARAALRDRVPGIFPPALALVSALAGLFVTSIGEYPPRTNVIMALILIEIGALIGFARLRREDLGSGGRL